VVEGHFPPAQTTPTWTTARTPLTARPVRTVTTVPEPTTAARVCTAATRRFPGGAYV